MGYTWAQFTAYLRLAKARAADRMLTDLVVQSNAFAGGAGAKTLVRELQRELQSQQ